MPSISAEPHSAQERMQKNLDEQEILSAIDYVHLRNRKLYLTVNTLLKEEELEEKLYPYLRPYYEQGLDAVIVQDMGVLKAVRSWFPDLDIHASTQMTVTGSAGARFLESLGATRVVPARELSFAEIQKIHRTTNLEIECFVHGALCYCYPGQCLFFQPDRRKKRKPRKMRAAVPSAVRSVR